MSSTRRTWYTYRFWYRNRIVHGGITENPSRREREHQQEWPGGTLRVVDGPMTEKRAREWERQNGYS